jgi:hypothetical protein
MLALLEEDKADCGVWEKGPEGGLKIQTSRSHDLDSWRGLCTGWAARTLQGRGPGAGPHPGFPVARLCAERPRYCPGQEGGAGGAGAARGRREEAAAAAAALGAPVTAGARQGRGSAGDVRARGPGHGARQPRRSRSRLSPGPAAAAAAAATVAAAAPARAARRREPGRWESRRGRGEAGPGPGGWGKGRDRASLDPGADMSRAESAVFSARWPAPRPQQHWVFMNPGFQAPASLSSVVPGPSPLPPAA